MSNTGIGLLLRRARRLVFRLVVDNRVLGKKEHLVLLCC